MKRLSSQVVSWNHTENRAIAPPSKENAHYVLITGFVGNNVSDAYKLLGFFTLNLIN